MAGAPVSVVADKDLHLTMDLIADVTEDRISQEERDELVVALREALVDVPAYHGTIGPCVAGGSGTMLYVSPASPLEGVQRRVTEVIRTLRGEGAVTWTPPRPHASLHYCNLAEGEYASSDPWNRLLRRAADSLLAPLRITEVLLVDVRPDNVTKDLNWTAVSDPIPLAGKRSDDSL